MTSKVSLGLKVSLGILGLGLAGAALSQLDGPAPPTHSKPVATPAVSPLGRPQSALYRLAQPDRARQSEPTVTQMMRDEEELNERCRGGSGDDPTTMSACNQRDQLVEKLRAAGTCWGNINDPNEIGADKTWRPCAPPNPRGDTIDAATSATAAAPQRDTITYDPALARKSEMADVAMASTRSCSLNFVRALLNRGERSRERIVDAVSRHCSTPLVNGGVMSPRDAISETRELSSRHLTMLEAEGR